MVDHDTNLWSSEESQLSDGYLSGCCKTASADSEATIYKVKPLTQSMEPKDIVAVGILLILLSLLLTLLTSIWIIPIGLFISIIGILLYLFKQYHERKIDSKLKQVE